MQEELKEELETIIDLLIDWTLRSGKDASICTVTRPTYISGFTTMPNSKYEIYKKMEDIR